VKLASFIPLIATAILCLTVFPGANAAPVADCTNDGNIVNIGSHYVCSGKGPCTNNGVVANVGSTYTCGTDCPNNGITVNVGSVYCGQDKNLQACLSSNCIGSAPPNRAAMCLTQIVSYCTGSGFCAVTIAGYCNETSDCTVNVAAVCTGHCEVNVAGVCNRPCTIQAVGLCQDLRIFLR
jgi:hypothetical protein